MYSFKSRVRYSEVDKDGCLSIEADELLVNIEFGKME